MNKNRLNFASLYKNFYQDLENEDKAIKINSNLLSKIKNNAIKQCVYSNKEIPKEWKAKLTYKEDIYNAINTDEKFALYLGTKSELNQPLKYCLTEIRNKNKKKKIQPKDLFLDTKIKIDEHIIDNNLEKYRKKYDFEKFMIELKTKRDEDKKLSLSKILEPSYGNRNKISIDKTNKSFKEFFTQNASTIYSNNDENNLYKKEMNNLKNSIFFNIIPTEENYNKKSLNNLHIDRSSLKNQKNRKKFISDFKVLKSLEEINYYGPKNICCNTCLERNLNYYRVNEPNQSLKLLNFLKKIREKQKKY